ncbi:CoA-disulfide reductase [Mollicutes bacterium LVI A0039]|nr:CoA-disulfide reductase [Mollicutes bacterium LVI A0039]
MSNIIIIGGSAAGMSFAAKYKRNCPEDNILLFESQDYISFGACGLPYFVQDQFKDQNEMFARTPSQMIDSGIDVRVNHTVTSIDHENKTVTAKNQVYSYDKLIIATGATPIVPDFAEIDNNQVFSLTTMEDGKLLKAKLHSGIKHITIIGAGFIGLEVMDAAKHLGLDVTVIERSGSILKANFHNEMTEIVEQHIIDSGIDLKLNATVQSITTGERAIVSTDTESIETDAVVVAIGFTPNSKLIDCDKLLNGAIIVDSEGRTSTEDVYAVGDVASTRNIITGKDVYMPLATNANKFAKSLADSLAGMETTFTGMLGSACLRVLDYDMARTGLTERDLMHAGIEYKAKVVKDKTHTNYVIGNEDIYTKMIYCPNTYKLYGAQIVGKKDVVHRLNTLALAITAGVTTKELAYTDFAYAPPFARTWEALNTAANVCK